MLTRPPRLPKNVTTARAAVLASLLSPGEFDNDHMFGAGTIGLATVMRALVRRYRWPVLRQDFATKYGWACTWVLSAEAIQFTLDIKVRNWLDDYRTARAAADQGRLPLPTVDRHYRNFVSATETDQGRQDGQSVEES
jgi:hypothetical protein